MTTTSTADNLQLTTSQHALLDIFNFNSIICWCDVILRRGDISHILKTIRSFGGLFATWRIAVHQKIMSDFSLHHPSHLVVSIAATSPRYRSIVTLLNTNMQSSDYGGYDTYDYVGTGDAHDDEGMLLPGQTGRPADVNFEDPKVASMPKILLMGPRRGGKTSIQVSLLLTCISGRWICLF